MVLSVSFSPDGNTIASASGNEIRLWDAVSGNTIHILTGHTGGVEDVSFSTDGNTIASGNGDNTIRLWDVASGALIRTLTGHTWSVLSVSFSPDGNTIASGSRYGTILLWDVASGTLIRTLTGHTWSVSNVLFSPDGNKIASTSSNQFLLREVDTGERIHTLTGHEFGIRSVSFSPDGNTIASAGGNEIRLWDVASGNTIRTLTGYSVSFSPDGNSIASASSDNTVRLWDVASGTPIHTLTGHTGWVRSVSFSPDGNSIASASDDNTVRLWDVASGTPIHTLTGHMYDVESVSFSPDGNTIASGSLDGTVLLWELTPMLDDTLTYTSIIPEGISFFHVPLDVDGLDTVGDLRAKLGDAVSFLIVYDLASGEWRIDTDATPITAALGIVLSMTAEQTVTFEGKSWGSGTSMISLQAGLNFIGLPINDPNLTQVSDIIGLFAPGVVANVIVSAEAEFKAVTKAGDPGDEAVRGDVAYLVTATAAATATLNGEGWTDSESTGAAPIVLAGYTPHTQTPVLFVEGAVVDETDGLPMEGFRVKVKNLSTQVTHNHVTANEDAQRKYSIVFVDLETVNAARVGDVLEISADSPNPLMGVQPVRYTVTSADVKRSRIELEALIAYEIPAETELLRNYPNPFNPETWIPYRLAEDADVSLTIYDVNGELVRAIDVGHQIAAVYASRAKAIYWDGRNRLGEQVASGVYFYSLRAGDFSATRKMVILK